MTNQDIQKFAELLTAEEAHVLTELETVATKDPNTPGGYKPKQADYGDETRDDELASEMTGSETNLALEQQLKAELDAIHKAQEKLKNGSYGVCETCGVEIPPPRLEALPATPYCVTCAEATNP